MLLHHRGTFAPLGIADAKALPVGACPIGPLKLDEAAASSSPEHGPAVLTVTS